MGFVIGWTIIVGMFIGRYGLSYLPFLFVVNAVFSILGTFIYSLIREKVSKEMIIFITVLLAASLLCLAVFFGKDSPVAFFGFLLAAEAVFLVQLKIAFNGFVETLFTPLESERTFPVIESSETIGGLTAGVLVTLFASSVDTSFFVYLWIFTLFCVLICLLVRKFLNKGIYRFSMSVDNEEPQISEHAGGLFSKIRDAASQIRSVSFIKGLLVVVILQWIFANLIEFQYTKAVTENISAAVLNSGSGFEHALVHSLGSLSIIFSASALVVQLFVGSRLITSLGIIGSMMLYPVVMLLSVLGLSVRFGLPTAVLAQTSHTITHTIYLNSYHAAYYSIKEHFREHTRGFIEGIVKPFGALIGTILLIVSQKFFHGENLNLVLNLVMMAVLVCLFFVIYGLQKKYTKVALHNLLRSEDKIERVEAIDILSQKGHKSALSGLLQVLNDPKESDFMKIKVLNAFGELNELGAIDSIISVFKSHKLDLRIAAVDALTSYKSVKNLFHENLFYEYKIIEALKNLYINEKNEEIRSKIVRFISRLSLSGTFGFLLEELKKTTGQLRAEVIVSLGNYKDENIVAIIEPFLESPSPIEKAAAVMALWKYPDRREDLEFIVSKMLKHRNKNVIRSAIYAIGEVGIKSHRKKCLEYLHSFDHFLKFHSILALAKMKNAESIKAISDILFGENQEMALEMKKALLTLPHGVYKKINEQVKKNVSLRINELLEKTRTSSLKSLNERYLNYLKMLYSLADETEEVNVIDELLYAKKYS